ncbi:NACHT domain-containing protein [Aquincola sp. S2]|uniref:NACHT domain-containing protein n=1 Tax=Pseudaquabacterium terrae TaxID=2732868 RepID=A0ABX2ERT5_9BURK|nr:NACHT domain-containing protein [Aquabacterium terrae]NRF71445.1 NACHT domain-containing protein [Aquabacterium terrae]
MSDVLRQAIDDRVRDALGRMDSLGHGLNFQQTDAATVLSDGLAQHLSSVRRWSRQGGSPIDLRPSGFRRNWIAPAFFRVDHYDSVSLGAHRATISFEQLLLLSHEEHIVVLGPPGSGKTTLLKAIAGILLDRVENRSKQVPLPLYVPLRTVSTLAPPRGLLVAAVEQALLLNERLGKQATAFPLLRFLDLLGVSLLFDGIDEIPFATGIDAAWGEAVQLLGTLKHSRALITHRTALMPRMRIPAATFEIAPFGMDAVRQLALAELGDERTAGRFVVGLTNSPYADVATSPLMLTLLLGVFTRFGELPNRGLDVYRRMVSLSLNEWDEMRGIRREHSARLSSDQLHGLLSHVAFESTSRGYSNFSEERLASWIKLHPNQIVSSDSGVSMAIDILLGGGLLFRTGTDSISFAHKSIQEFLCAEYIVRLPLARSAKWATRLPSEMALVIGLSSDPTSYFCELVLNKYVADDCPPEAAARLVHRLRLEGVAILSNSDSILAAALLLIRTESRAPLELLAPPPSAQVSAEAVLSYYSPSRSTQNEVQLHRSKTHQRHPLPESISVSMAAWSALTEAVPLARGDA